MVAGQLAKDSIKNSTKKQKMNSVTIGIDLGGTRIKAVAINDEGKILHEIYQSTNDDGDDKGWKNAVFEVVTKIQLQLGVKKVTIGLSAPGLPNQDNTAIAFMPGRMQGIENFIWKDFLNNPTFVLNDAIAAMVAESKFGAAKNIKNAILLTLGTGVGGAILIDGKPYQGSGRKAGHIGHMVINDEGEINATGMPGSLEDCIGNKSIFIRSKGVYNSTHELINAYRVGNDFAAAIWHKSVRQLAIGLASLSNILSPEIIIIGGGIAEAGDDLFKPLSEFMNQYEWCPFGNKMKIVKAAYTDMAGAVGAACFARDITEKLENKFEFK